MPNRVDRLDVLSPRERALFDVLVIVRVVVTLFIAAAVAAIAFVAPLEEPLRGEALPATSASWSASPGTANQPVCDLSA